MKNKIKRFLNNKIFEYFILSFLFFVGFLLRIYKISSPIADWHSWRQADTASVSRIYKEEGINLLYPRYYDISSIQTGFYNPQGYRFVEFPLYNAIHALLSKSLTFLTLEEWGRILSIFFFLNSAYLVFVIGKWIFKRKIEAFFSLIFYLFLPFNLYFSRTILPEPMGVFFALLFLWVFILFITYQKMAFLYLSAVFFAFSLLVKPFFFFYFFPALYLLVKRFGFKKIFNADLFIPLLIFLNISLTPFFIWRIWINQNPIGIPNFSWIFNGDHIRFKPSFWRWIFGERIGKLILGIWGLIPFVLGILKKDERNHYFFIHSFLFGVFLYLCIVATGNVRHDYYQIIIIPAISFPFSAGFYYLLDKNPYLNVNLSRFIALFSLMMMFAVSFDQVRAFYNINHPEIVKAGVFVDKYLPKDALVIAPYNGDTAFLYQTKRRGWPVVDTSLDKLLKRNARYFVGVNLLDPDINILKKEHKLIKDGPDFIVFELIK